MSTEDSYLPNDTEQLKAMIAEQSVALAEYQRALDGHIVLIAQHKEMIAQHTALIAQREETITKHEVVIDSQHATIEQQLKKLEGLEQQLARLLRRQYGPQKERIDPDQLTLFTAEELIQLAKELEQGTTDSVSTDDGSSGNESAGEASDSTDAASTQKPQRKGHGRRPLPNHLPREVVVHELTGEERLCPCCGKLRMPIGREDSEQLEFIPAQLKVVQHQRIKYACRECEEHVIVAAKPPQPIDKGLPGPGLLAYITLSKHGDYLPLYRLEDILSRCGILLRRSTLCDWVAASADLLERLYDLMCRRICGSHVIHTDDTSIKMLSTGQCLSCKFWTYAGDNNNPYVAYTFSLTREGKEPRRFLQGFQGYLQADAYSGYDEVYSNGRVIEVACMAHCRRYWWEAKETDSRRAHEAISYIARLYTLENQFEKTQLTGEALRAARQQHSVPILAAFEIWLKKEQGNVLPKSLIGKAFMYTLNQWQALCRYTEDGALQIDNNLAERMVKLPAILRKNCLFVGSEKGGHRAAILLSIIASAKRCGVEPWAWLNAVLKELPVRLASATATGPPDLSDLLPDEWLKDHPEHRWEIDDIRKKERERSRQQKTGSR